MSRDIRISFAATLALAIGFLFGSAAMASCAPERPTVGGRCAVLIPTEAR